VKEGGGLGFRNRRVSRCSRECASKPGELVALSAFLFLRDGSLLQHLATVKGGSCDVERSDGDANLSN
jgi:hypothetical protein